MAGGKSIVYVLVLNPLLYLVAYGMGSLVTLAHLWCARRGTQLDQSLNSCLLIDSFAGKGLPRVSNCQNTFGPLG